MLVVVRNEYRNGEVIMRIVCVKAVTMYEMFWKMLTLSIAKLGTGNNV